MQLGREQLCALGLVALADTVQSVAVQSVTLTHTSRGLRAVIDGVTFELDSAAVSVAAQALADSTADQYTGVLRTIVSALLHRIAVPAAQGMSVDMRCLRLQCAGQLADCDVPQPAQLPARCNCNACWQVVVQLTGSLLSTLLRTGFLLAVAACIVAWQIVLHIRLHAVCLHAWLQVRCLGCCGSLLFSQFRMCTVASCAVAIWLARTNAVDRHVRYWLLLAMARQT